MNKLLIFSLFTSIVKGNLEANVNDLIRLIQHERERAETYLLPNDSEEYRPKSRNQIYFGSFDHIVVGAGAAGAIIATRLSESGKNTILLLEAGGPETNLTDIPAMSMKCNMAEYNWNHYTIPQNSSCLKYQNGQCNYPRGKGIGGSTTINGLFYARGNSRDYDSWRDSGNPGWGFQDVLPFFKKLENFKIDGDVDHHGYKGYMNVEQKDPVTKKTVAFLNANRELGRNIGDYNGKNPLCAGRVQVNTIKGRRCSTGRAYIRRVWGYRTNLHVSPHSYVTKILIDPITKRAYGVVFAKDKKYYVAVSKNEVIISAGVFGSPQILMLSGIGPSRHLTNLGIPIIQDLPVGMALQDHFSYTGLQFHSNHSDEIRGLNEMVHDYLKFKGALTDVYADAVAFVQTNLSTTPNHPDIEIVLYDFKAPEYNVQPLVNFERTFHMRTILLRPKSQGSLRLRSSDPFEYPLINPNIFSDNYNEDMETMYQGIQLALQLSRTKSFKELGTKLIHVHVPDYLGTFDHIVIGAGSAGAIVAARLSEDCNKSILLLEAGDHETDFTDIPAMNSVSTNLQYNWNYNSIAQNYSCRIFPNGVCSYTAGRGLGGSTIINGLVYARGCEWDYDNWALLGNDLWGYDKVLPFFKKLENYQISGDEGYHGYSGPVNVEYSEPLNPRTTTFLNANRELGKEIGDYNGENPFRAGRIQSNIIRGQRCSTGRAYLRRVWRYRKNLHVLARSYVTKILVNVQTKRAYGVVFAKGKQYFIAKSRNEIVLSAGTYRSPQILMLSGIGPKEHLMSLRIPVITDLPVGKVFKDCSTYSGLHIYTNHSNSDQELNDQVRDYLHGKGVLTNGGTSLGVVFLKSNLSSVPQRPDIEVIMSNFPQYYSTFFNITDIGNAVIISPILLHPKSSGSITLNSSDPFEYPIINPNLFSDPKGEDMETLLEGIRYALELIKTESFKKINATLMMVHLPQCKDYTYLSNEFFRCHATYFEESVKYYLNLIRNEQARSEKFSLPNDSSEFEPLTNEYTDYGTFDHIVVGAGAAGAVTASRLSEDKNRSILLLEAGGEETDFTDIPSMNGYALGLEYNWNYYTIPQKTSCLGMHKGQCRYARGKGLGGSTIVNGLMYTRGNKRDFNEWYQKGNKGWAYDDVLPLFKKSENSLINQSEIYHGIGGNVNVEYSMPMNRHVDIFLKANQELGRNVVDYNGKDQLGVGMTQLNNIKGRRGSTGRAFLRPFRNRKNLNILTHSYVIKIIISAETKRAIGVLFVKDKKCFIAKSRQDIIISAGSIGSPQLLMLSGIGPKLHLQQLGIPLVQDLPVGNFKDHFAYSALYFKANYSTEVLDFETSIRQYLNSYGPLTNSASVFGIAFIQTNLTRVDGYPDIECVSLQWGNELNMARRIYNWNDELLKINFPEVDVTRTFTIQVVLLHPKSQGYLRLKSANPFKYPLIDPRYLSDENGEDIETMYQGIQSVLQLLETDAFRNAGVTLMDGTVPACLEHEHNTREYWYCQLRHLAAPYAHPYGTSAMGPSNQESSVVDPELKVHGIKNLRVADASIIPGPITAHTGAPSMMIGEKVAELIFSTTM
ncbi:hypothetical protein RI129_007920 [Pyrocoelia pectoralis]|uniref:Glucose-methanol-choline oxidoreductase N-terminal domain-containing protein n=1 Tax=Pyrocoelia pectoralis TaxID=417401 RepID=A0AAN7ZFA4_9COLE